MNFKNQYKIRIDNPCEQSWDKMQASPKGKFCLHCSKDVIDFSHLTDIEIINVIEQSSGKLCGRFTSKQLNKVISHPKKGPDTSIFSKIAAGFLLMGNTGNLSASKVQTPVEMVFGLKTTEEQAPIHQPIEKTAIGKDSLKNVLQGQIIDEESKEALPGMMIFIRNTSIGVSTDINGYFKFAIPDHEIKDTIHIVVSCLGWQTREMIILKSALPLTKEISMQPEIMGGIMIQRQSWIKRMWWRIKGFFYTI